MQNKVKAQDQPNAQKSGMGPSNLVKPIYEHWNVIKNKRNECFCPKKRVYNLHQTL